MERDAGTLTPEAAASALAWWLDAGVDALVSEEPRNWLAPQAKTPEPPTDAPPITKTSEIPDQLPLFRGWLADSPDVPLAAPGAPRICPAGDPASGLMILIDMPAPEDCHANQLIAGAPGQLFDRMLKAMGRDRESIYLAALSCVSAPGGGLPPQDTARCTDLARHHVALAGPKAVLVLGDACAKAMLGGSVTQVRGTVREIETTQGPFKAVATFSPAHLLRVPAAKAHAWADLQLLMDLMK